MKMSRAYFNPIVQHSEVITKQILFAMKNGKVKALEVHKIHKPEDIFSLARFLRF